MKNELKKFWDSPWGFEKTDGPPDRREFFPEIDDESAWSSARSNMEDFWQHNCVFYNPMKMAPCHSDSYMTCVSFDNLLECIGLIKNAYKPSSDEVLKLCGPIVEMDTFVPALKIAASLFMKDDNWKQ